MLSTYWHVMRGPKIDRTGGYTYDHRDNTELIKELQATVEALKARLKAMEEAAK